jgi:hypothetical protein
MVANSGQIPQRAGSSVVAVQSELIRTLIVEARDILYASLCLLLLSLPYARARMIQTRGKLEFAVVKLIVKEAPDVAGQQKRVEEKESLRASRVRDGFAFVRRIAL